MQSFDHDATYRLTAALLKAIQNGERLALSACAVSPAIYAEIIEELEYSGQKVTELTVPPYHLAFKPDGSGRVPLDIYQTEADPQSRRVACQLWSAGVKTDLTLIADYSENHGQAALRFRLLETQ
ncbi:hypothetical protein GV819_17985 [Pseudomonas sp. Fl5BN2]|uniref:hypothetical protein n=1 Tax=unclassified Pseudomonas TaxID=196821 RepID=UPI00137878A3|nr:MULTISPECIES: hypothetical protein [unclassified Pseudomonas]NBF04175.1 hypothetical protein [Pseudomonas sp. Fl5BN2]NBF09940.1 hypothetical protein [Pseudomonas sp. Fl4BN1]